MSTDIYTGQLTEEGKKLFDQFLYHPPQRRRVKPLTGQVLIELDDREKRSPGGIDLPEHTLSPEEHQERARHPSPPPGITGKVVEMGAWPRLKNGMAVLPPFGIGARVVIRPTSGVEFRWNVAGKLKLVSSEDVLAILK